MDEKKRNFRPPAQQLCWPAAGDFQSSPIQWLNHGVSNTATEITSTKTHNRAKGRNQHNKTSQEDKTNEVKMQLAGVKAMVGHKGQKLQNMVDHSSHKVHKWCKNEKEGKF